MLLSQYDARLLHATKKARLLAEAKQRSFLSLKIACP